MKNYNLFANGDNSAEEAKNRYQPMPIPAKLNEICLFLKNEKISLSTSSSDGRVNSSINEDELLKIIKKQFDIQIPKSRAWYDFVIETENEFLPVNIKITDTTHADNLNCKLGIYYALTGLKPDFANEIDWLSYFERLKEHLGKVKTNDYYFLIVRGCLG